MPSWFARKNELPVPPPEPPPSAAARKAKEQGWFESIRSRTKTGSSASLSSPSSSPSSPLDAGRTRKAALGRRKSRIGFLGVGILGGSSVSLTSRGKETPPASPSLHPDSPGHARLSPPDEFGQRLAPSPSLSGRLVKTRRSRSTLRANGDAQEADETLTPSKSARPAEPRSSSKSLAQRLQELATANEDGLLDDDEYRVLREGIFATSGTAQEALVTNEPKSNGLLGLPEAYTASRTSLAPPIDLERRSSRAPSIRPSIRSTRSTASFLSSVFRRGSKSVAPYSRWEDGAPASPRGSFSSHLVRPPSTYSAQVSVHSAASTVARRRGSRPSDLETDVPPLPDGTPSSPSPVRTRSIRIRPELGNAAPSSSNSLRSARSRPKTSSSASVLTSSSTEHSNPRPTASSYSRSSRIAALNDQADLLLSPHPYAANKAEPSAAELRREIAEIEEECSRLLETFREMERAVVARSRTVPASSAAAAAAAVASASPSVNVNGGEDEDGAADGGKENREGEGARKRPTSFLAPLPPAEAFEARRKSRGGPAGSLRRVKRRVSVGDSLPPSASPPTPGVRSSLDSARQQTQTTRPRSRSHLVVAAGQQAPEDGQEVEGDAGLKKEVDGILARRRAVEQKYEQRLEYLRAKLKGAMIRERLPR